MKPVLLILGLTAALGAAQVTPGIKHVKEVVSGDADFAWNEASGPQGERNPAAFPLYKAVVGRDVGAVRRLLENGASPNLLLASHRWSALMVAIALNEDEVVKLLLEHGADVNYVSNDRVQGTPLATALTFAVPKQDFTTFNQLLDRGANVNLAYSDEDVALHAVDLGQMKVLNDLLARGYRRDLSRLRRALEWRRVDQATEPEKVRAIQTVQHLLAQKTGKQGS